MAEVPLRDLVDARLAALEKRIDDVDDRAKEAIREARSTGQAQELRQNEWRGTVNDLASKKAERDVVDTMMSAISDRINALSRTIDGMQGKSTGIGASVSVAISLASLAAVVIFEILRK